MSCTAGSFECGPSGIGSAPVAMAIALASSWSARAASARIAVRRACLLAPPPRGVLSAGIVNVVGSVGGTAQIIDRHDAAGRLVRLLHASVRALRATTARGITYRPSDGRCHRRRDLANRGWADPSARGWRLRELRVAGQPAIWPGVRCHDPGRSWLFSSGPTGPCTGTSVASAVHRTNADLIVHA